MTPSRFIANLIAAGFLLLLGTSCGTSLNGRGAVSQSREIVFPVQDPTSDKMQALLRGTLTLKGECLYVSVDEPKQLVLPIWPSGFGYERTDGGVVVLDAQGEEVARTESLLSTAGGMFGQEGTPLSSELRSRVESCHGPYWIVGYVTPSE